MSDSTDFKSAPISTSASTSASTKASTKAATGTAPVVPLETVAKVARLARLSLSETDAPRYAGEMAAVLALVEQMSAVDTSGVEPMAHPVPLGEGKSSQRLRADAVTEHDQREAFQAIAPETAEGLYLVPRVID